MTSAPGDLSSIKHRYLLVLHIPVYVAADGARWIDGLWYKDLVEHLAYIDDFTLACPCMPLPSDTSSLVRVTDPRIKFVDLPGRRKLTLGLPATVRRLWQAIGCAEIVHTGLGGWLPISLGNMTSFMARLRGRFLFIIVESSPWRLVPGQRHGLVARMQSALAEWMNRNCLARVDLAIFTQDQYRLSLMPHHPERGHVIHASWIDDAVIAPAAEAEEMWRAKSGRPLKVLFAGRLTTAKGVPVLLDAIHRLDAAGRAVELHVIGQGELIDRCREAAAGLRHARIELLPPRPYGPEFFHFLRDYHAVVVPSITDEQPRIVYDAYSQGVPVIASDTGGLRDCVDDGVTGWLCAPNDAPALSAQLERGAQDVSRLQAMGPACLARAREMTHQHMHQRRLVLLNERLRQRPRLAAS